MASDELARSVSRKLKYYFQVKRLEDSFDLSGSHVPVLDHPPRICGPIVHYPSVYDRSLKHYFSHPEARVQLTQFKSPLDQGDSLEKMGKIMTKEEKIRRMVEKYLRRYNFAPAARSEESSPQPVPFQAFVQTKKGIRLRPELRGIRGPYRTAGRRANGFHGAYPVLRMTPNSDISKQEGSRLVNTATRLLLATQTIDLSSENYDTTASGTKLQYLPNSNKAQAAERRRQTRSGGRSAGRSSSRPSGSSSENRKISVKTKNQRPTSSENSNQDRNHMPAWLRKEISRLADEENSRGGSHDQSPYVRAYSAPTPPKGERRSSSGSSGRRRSLRRRTIGDGSENIATQTERRSTDPDDQITQLVEDKDQIKYEVLVTTGNHIGASTNADIYLTLFGSLGRSPEIQLTNSKTHRLMFRKSQTDEFSVNLPYVGVLKRLQIGHNSLESGSDWYLESVQVIDPRSNQCSLFKCNRWLSSREEDSLTKRILFPSQDSATKSDNSKPEDSGRSSRASTASSATSSAMSGSTAEERERRTARSRSDSESSTEATASSTGFAEEEDGEESAEDSSEGSYTDASSDEETAKEEEEVEAEDSEEEEEPKAEQRNEGARKSHEESRSSLNPIEEEGGVESPRSSSVASSRESHASEQPDVVSSDEEDEMGRVEEEDAAEFDFDDKRNAPVKSIHQAVEDGDLAQVIELVSNSESLAKHHFSDYVTETTMEYLFRSPDERGFMPLHIACERGHLHIIGWLCSNGANIEAETPTGYGPLHLTTLEGHLDCMKTLRELGANLNSTTTDGQTALHIAAKNAHLDVVKWLVGEGADVNAEDLRGMRAIAWARQYGHTDVVQYLRSVSGDTGEPNDDEPSLSTTPPPVRVMPKRLSRRLTEESLLQEKRKNYQKQMDNMSTSSSTFLDAIRNETIDNDDIVRE